MATPETSFSILYDVRMVTIVGQLSNAFGQIIPCGRVFVQYEWGPTVKIEADTDGIFEVKVREGDEFTLIIPDLMYDKKFYATPMGAGVLSINYRDIPTSDGPNRWGTPMITPLR